MSVKLQLSLEEAAEAVSLSVSFIRKEIQSGRLTAKRYGQKYRVRLVDLEAWLESRPDA